MCLTEKVDIKKIEWGWLALAWFINSKLSLLTAIGKVYISR